MFQQLVPLLRQRSVLLTVTSLEDDQIRINIMPKKLKDGENNVLTTPMSFMGTATELDAQLPDAIVSFVASHLELKNTLARAKEEMDAATKAAQEEARNKAKNNKKPSSESAGKVDPAAEEEQKKEPDRRERVLFCEQRHHLRGSSRVFIDQNHNAAVKELGAKPLCLKDNRLLRAQS
ncbi:MAG TPA: PRTRC system protein E [Edaphobacter sp.]|nr:PRTRC system protein E [Edaphobacter sp.]